MERVKIEALKKGSERLVVVSGNKLSLAVGYRLECGHNNTGQVEVFIHWVDFTSHPGLHLFSPHCGFEPSHT
jgi:hypothetical protein